MGHIVGGYAFGEKGFIYRDGVLKDIHIPVPPPFGSSDAVFGINNREQFVGLYNSEGTGFGFLTDGAENFWTLDAPGATFTLASGINDFAEIVGYYIDVNGTHIGFLVQGIYDISSLVTFAPQPATYRTSTNTSGCPAGYAGKFTFDASLTNTSSQALRGLTTSITTLTNNNLMLDPQTNALLSVHGNASIAKTGMYADGVLESQGKALKSPIPCVSATPRSFLFRVTVFGVSE